jgi:predicted nucleic acid-binding protein
MRVFLDANVLVAIVNKEYPLFSHAARILSLAGTPKFEIYTSPICLAITFYFAEKKFRSAKAREKLSLLCRHINIAEATASSVKATLQNKEILDFEDGLEYYAAMEAGCNCIVTEDGDDFHFSKIEVLSCEDFFIKYLMKKGVKA